MLFESPDFAVWEWKYAWKKLWVRIIVQYQSGGCTSFFFFFSPTFRVFYLFFFLFRTSLFFPAVQGNHFFSHRDHALWRHVEFEMEKENGRISCSCNTWKKIKTCSVDLCYHQQLVTPGASTAFKHVCYQPALPGTSSKQLPSLGMQIHCFCLSYLSADVPTPQKLSDLVWVQQQWQNSWITLECSGAR